jgi:hypothetical protein
VPAVERHSSRCVADPFELYDILCGGARNAPRGEAAADQEYGTGDTAMH